MKDFDELVNQMADADAEIEESVPETGAAYLQKYLLDIQNYLNDEIATRKAVSSFLGLLLAQSANYTFSLLLISSGAEFFSSTLIGLIIGLMPGVADISQINQKSNKPVEKYLPVAVKALIALFTSGIIFTQITLPHMASRHEIDQIYSDIELIERGRPNNTMLDNLKNSPITPIAIILLLYTGFSMAQSKKD
jgi:type III secretory pathway component EscS